MLAKAPPVAVRERQRDPFALAERRGHGVGETPAVRFPHGEPVHHDEHLRGLPHPPLSVRLVEP